LQTEVQLLKNGKNSKTSHTSPLNDIGRSNTKSLRAKTVKKSGGQLGHEGNTLLMSATPDKEIHHPIDYCNFCGNSLNSSTAVLLGKRQEVIIPAITPQIVEHSIYSKTCTCCHSVTKSNFPPHVTSSIQYGVDIQAFVAYLSVYQYMPMKRIVDMIKTIFGIALSEGTVANMLKLVAEKSTKAYDIIKQRIEQSSVVGADETGAKIEGKKGWFFTWQNKSLTFIKASFNRGYNTIIECFENGFKKAVYISDCLAAQLKVVAAQHQLCIVHLLRELNNFEDALQCQWSTQLKQLLQNAIDLKSKLTPSEYINTPQQVLNIQEQLKTLLQKSTEGLHPKLKAFINRLQKQQQSLLTFLYHQQVPPDNNGSERAIRNIKVKTKVSTQFRTLNGAKQFAVIRSVVDTAIKNGNSPIGAIKNICSI
jgi:transposase